MDVRRLKQLIEQVRDGKLAVDEALAGLRNLPFEDLGFANIDHHRALRRGYPEVIYGQGKNPEDMVEIIRKMVAKDENILVTKLTDEKAAILKEHFPGGKYFAAPKVFTLETHPVEKRGKGIILVISAGTSDIPVAEEAAITARFMGNDVETIFDVGVSGIHRILEKRNALANASVIVVAAGMEGALPSIVGGLVDKPVIAVPTSIGYGASFKGLSALLGMLNSCACGVTVVNIDNGFGAGYAASLINRV
ncbi:MAG: nickel pincer cofactor biosynthesis protein LarB [Thermodesulfobacteriota bacterium]